MKLQARLHLKSGTGEHEIELPAPPSKNGLRSFRIGSQVVDADCEEIVPGVYSMLMDGRVYEAVIARQPGDSHDLASPFTVTLGSRQYIVELRDARRGRRTDAASSQVGPREILAPMPGKIVRILVREGQEVKHNQGLLVIEAMKMQNELRAPRPGRVDRVYAAEGRGVEAGAKLVRLA